MGKVVPFRREATARRGGRELAHLSDEALVALIARDDEEALTELYRRLAGAAYGLAHRVLRDDALAQDAVQEAFVAVWRSAARFRADRAKPRTWVLMFVHRRAVDLVRREERRRGDVLDEQARAQTDVRDEGDAAVLRQTIRTALRRLPPDQREAIELAYYGGYTQSELAERLGQPLGTIKSRMFAGLSRLRDLLEEPAAGEGATL
jgi:RNA polymerase sigma factor (sigma-70 family)